MLKTNDATESAKKTQDQYFNAANQMPVELWYWAAISSVIASAALFLVGRRDWSIFVGQWPPTFLLLGLFHKLIEPRR
jgi:hypothetical protein